MWLKKDVETNAGGKKMGSRRLEVAAEKIAAVQRKRWIRTGAAWAV